MPAISRPRSSFSHCLQLLAARLVRVALDRDVVEEPAELDAVVANAASTGRPDRAPPGGSNPNAMHQLPRQTFASFAICSSSCCWLSLVHVEAAVHVHMRAVDELRRVRREPDDDGGDLLGRSRAPERCVPDGTLAHLRGPGGDHRRVDDPRVDAVDPDPMRVRQSARRISSAPITPALEAAYDAPAASPPTCPASDAIVTIRPRPRGTIDRSAAWQARNVPRRLTAWIRSHSSGVIWSKASRGRRPRRSRGHRPTRTAPRRSRRPERRRRHP